jgi:hypothetical protein
MFCCPTCYKCLNSFCKTDTGEKINIRETERTTKNGQSRIMFQTYQYINTCLDIYMFHDSVSQDNVYLYALQEIVNLLQNYF